jgi:hypothetical protein
VEEEEEEEVVVEGVEECSLPAVVVVRFRE